MNRTISPIALSLLALAGCGGDEKTTPGGRSPSAENRLPRELSQLPAVRAAQRLRIADFPAVEGRTLTQLARDVNGGPQVGFATSVLLPGRNRLAFGVIDAQRRFLYGKTAVYVARRPGDRARGPFLAPLDLMTPAQRYRSRTTSGDPASAKAVYETEVGFPRAGRYAVLTLTKVGRLLTGAPSFVTVRRASPIPDIGERAPAIDTPTVQSVGGDISSIETRVPPDEMHRVSFRDVVGKRPVALLFATPALCESRTCGPVTDVAVQLQATYGRRMTFIHNEVYVDNDPNKGLRPQLTAFHLETEPWLFTFDEQGRVAARLEGAFGIRAFRRAVQAALR